MCIQHSSLNQPYTLDLYDWALVEVTVPSFKGGKNHCKITAFDCLEVFVTPYFGDKFV